MGDDGVVRRVAFELVEQDTKDTKDTMRWTALGLETAQVGTNVMALLKNSTVTWALSTLRIKTVGAMRVFSGFFNLIQSEDKALLDGTC